jgi:hypothetical protein
MVGKSDHRTKDTQDKQGKDETVPKARVVAIGLPHHHSARQRRMAVAKAGGLVPVRQVAKLPRHLQNDLAGTDIIEPAGQAEARRRNVEADADIVNH